VISRVCVAGSGVIGSLLAGHLAQVAEVSVLARRDEHARALNDRGLTVTGRAELRGAITAATDPAELPAPDLVLVCCKGTDVDAVGARLAGHFPDAMVMTLQNGLGADDLVGRHGDWPLLAAVTFMSGTRHSDTEVEYILDTATWIGPSRDTTGDDARRVAELIRSSGLKAEGYDDLRPMQWSKLIFNATVNGVAALTGLPHEPRFAQVAEPGDLGHLVRGLMDEGKAVAAASGIGLAEDPWEMNVHATERGSRHYPSMLEDVEAHRPTEVELINGSVIRAASRAGVPVPLHETIYRLVKAKEASWE
jgi:2-dehydropantoate 2-reductase